MTSLPLGSSGQNSRIDLFRIVIGEAADNNKFEVAAIYVHTLGYYLPLRIIKLILKEEFEPEDIYLMLSRHLATAADQLNNYFLKQVNAAGLEPLRSECYGTAPQAVTWHFFAPAEMDNLAGIVRKMANVA